MDVAVVGAGRVGTALAVLLGRAGHRVVGVSGRDATAERAARHLPGVPVLPAADAAARAEVVLVGVPDGRIAGTVSDLAGQEAFRGGQVVAHLSGAAGLAPLAAAMSAGASGLCLHPLQTFPSVQAALERMAGVAFAVTGSDERAALAGERLARDVGGAPFRLAEEARPLYHAAAVLGSNDVVALAGLAAGLLGEAGVPEPLAALRPLAEAALANATGSGPEAALTGPVVRGDAGTVEANLRALGPERPAAVAAYVSLARVALDLAVRGGRLGEEPRRRVEEVLERWS